MIQGGERALNAHGQLDVKRIIRRQTMIPANRLNGSEYLIQGYRIKGRAQGAQTTKKGLGLIAGNSSPPLANEQ